MNKLRNAVFAGLAGTLFSITVACGQAQAIPTPTPTPITSRVDMASPSGVINSIKNYKPTENEIKTAEAIRYLNSSHDRQSAISYVSQNYGESGSRAIRLVNNAQTYKHQIVYNSAEGRPYAINELEAMLGTGNPLELSLLLDNVFENVYVLNVNENEMVEFRKAVKSYKEFKEATGFGASEYPNISPELEAVTAYTVIFLARSIHQDPITAHKYALAIARDEETRKGVVQITYDLYVGGKRATEATGEKLKEQGITPENIGNRISEFKKQKAEEIKKESGRQQEKTKQQTEELKRKAGEELKKKQQELQQQQEKAKQQAEELKRRSEEELRRQAEEQRKRLEQEAEKAKEKVREGIEKTKEDLRDLFKKKK